MSHPLAADFMRLFTGFGEAYGIYNLTGEVTDSGKQKGRAASKKGLVTTDLWELHLKGEQGLGIIPINNDSKVRFGAIDIDEYPLDHVSLNKNLVDHGIPLVQTRTKSGGAHLWLFLDDWTEAKFVQDQLKRFAAFLGYGNAEIFPKQSQILAERGDVGQWINMPYFDCHKTTRYGWGDTHKALTAEGFIQYVDRRTVSAQVVKDVHLQEMEVLPGGPPCLQHILSHGGFPEGTRNNGLFNLGVYAMKSSPDNFQGKIEELNAKHMDPPLSGQEVLGVIKSIRKKEYTYTCSTQPMARYCNKAKCRACKFGIGQGDLGMPVFGTLTKVCTTPPVWFLDVEGGGRLQLRTEDLQSPFLFQLKCMETLNVMPGRIKAEQWAEIVGKLLAKVALVDVPRDVTPKGQMLAHLEDFLTGRAQANSAPEILLGKPWLSGKYYHFRMRDFFTFLERKKFFDMRNHEVTVVLQQELEMQHKFINLGGKGTNTYIIHESYFQKQSEKFDTPKMDEEKPY
jgi:hypothetical protein